MTFHQAAPHIMAGDLKDHRGTGDKIVGAGTEIWIETDHGRETGNRTGVGSNDKGTGAEKEMMSVTGTADEVGRENTVECQKDVKKEREGNTAVMSKVKVTQMKEVCLKDSPQALKEMTAQ